MMPIHNEKSRLKCSVIGLAIMGIRLFVPGDTMASRTHQVTSPKVWLSYIKCQLSQRCKHRLFFDAYSRIVGTMRPLVSAGGIFFVSKQCVRSQTLCIYWTPLFMPTRHDTFILKDIKSRVANSQCKI